MGECRRAHKAEKKSAYLVAKGGVGRGGSTWRLGGRSHIGWPPKGRATMMINDGEWEKRSA